MYCRRRGSSQASGRAPGLPPRVERPLIRGFLRQRDATERCGRGQCEPGQRHQHSHDFLPLNGDLSFGLVDLLGELENSGLLSLPETHVAERRPHRGVAPGIRRVWPRPGELRPTRLAIGVMEHPRFDGAWVRANSLVVLNECGDLSVISVNSRYAARVRLPNGKMPRGNVGDHRFPGDDEEIAVLCAGDVNDRGAGRLPSVRSAPTASARPARRRPATAAVRVMPRRAWRRIAPARSWRAGICAPNKSTPGRSKFASGNRRAATSLDMAPMT